MQPALDRFNVQMSWERPKWSSMRRGEFEVKSECEVCGEIAHYRLQGLKGDYCRVCCKEVAADLGMDFEEEMELIP